MAMTNAYLTLAEFRDLMRDQLTAYDHEYEMAIEAASRQVDDFCGRHFYMEEVATPKLYRPDQVDLVWTADIATTDGLVVKTDDDDDGAFETTWSADEYMLEPYDRLNGTRPYERIAAVSGREFPVACRTTYSSRTSTRRSRRPRVQVTAKWGWPEVPAEVKQATAILAVDHFRTKDQSQIASQYGTGTRFTRDITARQYGAAIQFTRFRAPVFNPEAEALLMPLRVVVVAAHGCTCRCTSGTRRVADRGRDRRARQSSLRVSAGLAAGVQLLRVGGTPLRRRDLLR